MEDKDLNSRADIEKLLIAFYGKVVQDETIGIIFTKIFPLNLQSHIPVITDFWETILFGKPVYKKNAMEIHFEINKVYQLERKHFDAWLHLFNTTIDEFYTGEKATLAKKRALGIAMLMQSKMEQINTNHG